MSVAKILALQVPDEELTEEQLQMMEDSCRQWLGCRERQKRLDELIRNLPS
jgi:hypothetical protein